MSDFATKLETTKTTEGKARCNLSRLKDRPGYRVVGSDLAGPLLVAICPMDTVFLWKRVGSGADAQFELEDSFPEGERSALAVPTGSDGSH